MFRSTNRCRIIARLNAGIRLEGYFHVPADASPAVRPYDALRDMKSGMLLLADVTISAPGESTTCAAVLVPREAIALLELPEEGWSPGSKQPG